LLKNNLGESSAKKALKAAIRKSKSQKWRTITEEVDNDPWDLGYKIVMKKLGCLPNTTMDETKMEEIVDTLFLTHPERVDLNEGPAPDDVSFFIEEELRQSAHSLRNKKAPGPDNILSEISKLAVSVCPSLLLDMYNGCLKNG